MKTATPSRKHSRTGSALLTTLILCTILGISVVSYLSLISQQCKLSSRSQNWNLSIGLVESGIEEGLQYLNNNRTHLISDGWTYNGGSYWIKRTFGNGNSYTVNVYPNPSDPNFPFIYARADIVASVFSYSSSPIMFAAVGQDRRVSRAVVATCSKSSMFTKAMVAKHQIDLHGNNISTDSFDSADSAYNTGGLYDPTKTKDAGDVASNDTIVNSVSIGNANIHGHVATGPGGSIAVGSQGAIGSHVWQKAGNHGKQPGWTSSDSNFTFPDTSLPYIAGIAPTSGSNVVTSIITNSVVVYSTNYYDNIINAGDYYATSLSGKTIVLGAARLTLPNGLSMSGNDSITIASTGKIEIYAGGTSCSIGGNGVINQPGLAANFILYCAPSVTSFSLSGNGGFTGVLVAPNVNITMNGGGNNTTDFIGALIVNSVTMNGHFNFHYDEALGRMPGNGRYLVTSWNEVAPW